MSRTAKRKNSRKKLWKILVVGAVFFFVAFGLFLFKMYPLENTEVPLLAPPPDAPYRDAVRPTEARVEDLLARMTLKEKIGQMALVEKNSIHEITDITTYGMGALLSGFGAKPADNTKGGWNDMVSGFVGASKSSRLGIPIFYGADAIHGHSNVLGATIFPHLISLGATGDAELVRDVARAGAEELVATGVRWSFSPTLDMPQDIRWGRTYETFSDDPKLVKTLGAAYVKGLQDSTEKNKASSSDIFVLSTPKHYIGAGGMTWGSSSNENFHIDQGTTPPSENALRETYLPPFEEAVRAGAKSIMVGLNSWGDTKLSAEKYLVTDVLKGELGFDGFVVSDWYGVYEIPGGDYKAAVTAINAGVDVVMLPFDYKTFISNVERAVKRGDILEARIDDAVRRILRTKFSLGLFDIEPSVQSSDSQSTPAHRALAREAVAKSLVLLKNEGVLPIKKNVQHILVAGSSADNVGRQSGAWTVEWQGVDGNWLPFGTSILEGIRERAGGAVRVEYEINANFATGTERADLGIAIVGEKPYAEGWGDHENPTLDASDIAAIKRLQATSKKVIVILVSGRPLIITDEIPLWDAAVAAWLPGSEGAGVADVLFGDKPFSGKLPLPWPSHTGQLPIAPDGSTSDGTQLLFPRYFGL